MTVQRQLILDIIKTTHGHLTPKEIFCIAKQKMPTIVLATVQNNLNYISDNDYMKRIKTAGEQNILTNLISS